MALVLFIIKRGKIYDVYDERSGWMEIVALVVLRLHFVSPLC